MTDTTPTRMEGTVTMIEGGGETLGSPDQAHLHSDGLRRPRGASVGRPAAPRKRLSKRVLRLLAWAAGVASFLSPWAVLGLAPKPVANAATQKPKVIVRHRVVNRV